MLLWTFVCKFLRGHIFSFLLSKYLRVEWLGHMVSLCLPIWGTARLFPKQLQHLIFPPAQHEGSNFSTSSIPVVFYLGYHILVGAKLCLTVLPLLLSISFLKLNWSPVPTLYSAVPLIVSTHPFQPNRPLFPTDPMKMPLPLWAPLSSHGCSLHPTFQLS